MLRDVEATSVTGSGSMMIVLWLHPLPRSRSHTTGSCIAASRKEGAGREGAGVEVLDVQKCWRYWRFCFCIQRRRRSRDSVGPNVCESFVRDSAGADVCNLEFEGERNVALRGGSEKMHKLIAYIYRVVVTGCYKQNKKVERVNLENHAKISGQER
jgi:hypothetical protein